jgi:hypothetical protein
MASNTLTGLSPAMFHGLDVVSREITGFTAAVTLNASAEQAALNDPIKIPITPSVTSVTNTPGVTPPDVSGQAISYTTLTITRSESVVIPWNGEQQKSARNAGFYRGVLSNQFQQALRELVRMVEVDLFNAAYKSASRAYGTPGTTPFGTAADLDDSAALAQILDDNGAPQSDRHLVLGSAAVRKLRGKQTLLLKANENGSNDFRRTGIISDEELSGFWLHNSSAVKPITKGTGASYVTSGSTAAGVNTIALVTGTGTVNAGDVVAFAADSANKYVVNSGVAAPGTITIGAPGARMTIPTANAMTLDGNYTPNVGFVRSAVQLVTRAPATPTDEDGRPMDQADDVMQITDPISGITFEVCVYRQFKQMAYYVGLAWGCAAIKPEHIAILQG